ncbi:hypothetical protein P1J78_12340 [Psychromarinibacter sp. C21-152]|uniref:Uncharacterized protein n=1 Tax=Psychromarinibacter sediminicola TaxID=3033385 RepID=A0AAE3TAE1_9RHOB|nr:hypothetical protein [Psychromarinibacter sediminicola]MDF0601525.1 hypothetical protein [Psychromarinibacter sediminicola]
MTRPGPRASRAVLACLLALPGLPGQAQDSMCNRVPAPEEIAGAFTLSASDTLMTIQGATRQDATSRGTTGVELRPAPEGTAGALVLQPLPDIGAAPLRVVGPEEDGCVGLDETEAAALTPDPVAPAEGCGPEDLPRLAGSFGWSSRDGAPLAADICLVIRDADTLHGSFRFASEAQDFSGVVAWQLRRQAD